MSRSLKTLAVLALITVMSFGLPVPRAYAKPITPGDSIFMKNQEDMTSLVAWIRELYPDGSLVTSEVDQLTRTLTLYWKPIDNRRDSLILPEARVRNIQVRSVEVPLGIDDIRSVLQEVLTDDSQVLARASGAKRIVSARYDIHANTVTAFIPSGSMIDKSNLAHQLSTGKRARVAVEERSEGLAARYNDFAPFYGGSLMISSTLNSPCSTGFGIFLNGSARVLTARHCTNQPYRTPVNSNSVGSQVWVDSGTAMAVFAATGHFKIWRGGVFSTSSSLVSGYADVNIGDYVCTGGGISGEHCSLRVNYMWNMGHDGIGYYYYISANEINGGVAVAQGDSGGPVFIPSASSVKAVGIIQSYNYVRACGQTYFQTVCGSEVGFTSVHSFLINQLGASLRTG